MVQFADNVLLENMVDALLCMFVHTSNRHQTAVKSLPHADLLAASPKGTPTNMVNE